MSTVEAMDADFEAFKKATTLRQLGAALGKTFIPVKGVTGDLDAILDTTLAELEEIFGSAEGFRRHLAAKLEVAELETRALEALGARVEA